MKILSNDIARCIGSGEAGEWREGCETCLRRISPADKNTPWMEPPAIIAFECEFLIEE